MEWFETLYKEDYLKLCGFGSLEQTIKEAEFIVNVLKLDSNSRVLDLCCGFGRHTHEISNLINCQIVGIDLSDEYLSIARKKYSAPNIKYLKGDMRNIQIKEQFDAVTNLFTSFGFFESDEDNEKVIQQVNKSLKNGGLFLLDIENKFNFVLNDVLKKEYHWQQIDNHKYCFIFNEYDLANEREIFNAKIIESDKEEINVGYNIRLYSLPELKSLFKRNGLELINFWGDFDKSEYSIHSRRLITLAKKTTSL
jgi:ubiquinone/menaquinone biosynthesis C-methylase UbiE